MKKKIDKDTLEYIVDNGKDKIFRCKWPIFLKLHEDISLEIYCLDESIEYYLNYISHEVKEFRRKVILDDFDMFDASCEKKVRGIIKVILDKEIRRKFKIQGISIVVNYWLEKIIVFQWKGFYIDPSEC